MYIIFALLGFSLLIIVHELGHFVMAKANGIKVEEFSIGMGPKILSVDGKETKYSIGILPIGGYVKMLGEEEESKDARSFSSKSPLRRISVIVAGVVMNFLFAIIIFTIILSKFGFTLPQVDTVIPDSPAAAAGILPGDKFLEIDNSKVRTSDDIVVGINIAKDRPVNLLIDSNGVEKEIVVTPKLVEEEGRQKYIVGFSFDVKKDPTFVESVKHSFKQSTSMIIQTFKSLKMIITGEANFKTDVGGPVTIIKMSGEAAKNGIWNLMNFLAFISINLAVFNMLPFPALDGGWTIILLIELITRKKVPEKIVGILNYVGIMILFGFMILVTVKDILFPVNF